MRKEFLRSAGTDLQEQATGRWAYFVPYNVPKETTLHLVLRLCGGAKKRQKSYATLEKNKRKRKKVMLAILQYYL